MGKTDTPNLTLDEKLAKAREVETAVKGAKTADDLTNVISTHFSFLGHKVVNRIILGSSPEDALRIKA